METDVLINLRNALLLSLAVAPGFLPQDNHPDPRGTLREQWLKLKVRVRSWKTKHPDKDHGSFWEIDMTKFEP
jgi:hypothetical protein